MAYPNTLSTPLPLLKKLTPASSTKDSHHHSALAHPHGGQQEVCSRHANNLHSGSKSKGLGLLFCFLKDERLTMRVKAISIQGPVSFFTGIEISPESGCLNLWPTVHLHRKVLFFRKPFFNQAPLFLCPQRYCIVFLIHHKKYWRALLT